MPKQDKEIRSVYVKSRIPRIGSVTQTELLIKASPDSILTIEQGGVLIESRKNPNEEHFIPLSNIADIVFVKPKDATTSKKTAG